MLEEARKYLICLVKKAIRKECYQGGDAKDLWSLASMLEYLISEYDESCAKKLDCILDQVKKICKNKVTTVFSSETDEEGSDSDFTIEVTCDIKPICYPFEIRVK